MTTSKKTLSCDTQVVHGPGHAGDKTGAIAPPIYQTSTYIQSSPGQATYEYTRTDNPTRGKLEKCLATLEGGEFAVATGTGMGSALLVAHALPRGSKILCGDDVYGGVYRLFTTVFQHTHVVKFVDMSEEAQWTKAIDSFRPHLVWLESPTNPLLKLADIEAICHASKKVGAQVLVDNTFMTPYFQRPLDRGAHIVLHSLTKYLNGHSDTLGGCLVLKDEDHYKRLHTLQNSLGPSLSPFDSWLIARGIRTLAVRMRAHEAGAKAVALFLEGHKGVERVFYPGLPSHPQYELALRQNKGHGGGMVSFYLRGDFSRAKDFLGRLQLFSLAESLGGVESLSNLPSRMTHASLPRERRERLGIGDNLIRLSVGIEDPKDLVNDLDQALA